MDVSTLQCDIVSASKIAYPDNIVKRKKHRVCVKPDTSPVKTVSAHKKRKR